MSDFTAMGLSSSVIHSIFLSVSFMAFFVSMFAVLTIYNAFIYNAIFAGMTLEHGHRFESTISAPKLTWIIISNSAVVILSIGMLLPWTRVRLVRYLCENTWVKPASSIDEFAGEAESRQSAIGDAYMDLEGIDIDVVI